MALPVRIIAVDGGDDKKKLCKDLGAEEYIDFTQVKDIAAEVTRITKYGAHGCIVFSAAKQGYEIAPSLVSNCQPEICTAKSSNETLRSGRVAQWLQSDCLRIRA